MSTAQDHDASIAFYRRVFGLCVTALLAWLLFQVVQPFLAPLAWACVIAYLVHPLQDRLARRLRGSESLSAGLLTSACFFLLIGPLALIGGAFASEAGTLVTAMQATVTRLQIGSVQAD